MCGRCVCAGSCGVDEVWGGDEGDGEVGGHALNVILPERYCNCST